MSTLAARFENKHIPEPNSGCWIWTAAGNRYGQIGGHDTSKLFPAHRVSWELHFGQIPPGIYVLHRCDNTWCVNPDHLFLGTQGDNVADMAAKGRHGAQQPQYRCPWRKLKSEDREAIRLAVGTQRQIAKQFGISKSRVGQIKRGER